MFTGERPEDQPPSRENRCDVKTFLGDFRNRTEILPDGPRRDRSDTRPIICPAEPYRKLFHGLTCLRCDRSKQARRRSKLRPIDNTPYARRRGPDPVLYPSVIQPGNDDALLALCEEIIGQGRKEIPVLRSPALHVRVYLDKAILLLEHLPQRIRERVHRVQEDSESIKTFQEVQVCRTSRRRRRSCGDRRRPPGPLTDRVRRKGAEPPNRLGRNGRRSLQTREVQ